MAAKAHSPAAALRKLLEDHVREWRLAKWRYDELRPGLLEGKKAEETEREMRAQVGALVDGPKWSGTVDGALVIYERGERAGGLDYQGAWTALLETAGPALRKKMEALLQPKPPTVLHKLTSE
jgi:hypothetical protein